MIPYEILAHRAASSVTEPKNSFLNAVIPERKEAINTLNRILNKAELSNGQIVKISGPLGIGKSRLVSEFINGLASEPYTILEARCVAYGENTPYAPFISAIKRDIKISDSEPLESSHEKIVAALKQMGLEDELPALLYLLSIPSNEYKFDNEISAEQIQLRIQKGLRSLNTKNLQKKTKIWILEDWQWADDSSKKTLDSHLKVLQDLQMMIIILQREGKTEELPSSENSSVIHLSNFGQESIAALLVGMLGVEEYPIELEAELHKRSGGNPFFLAELLKLCISENLIEIKENKAVLNSPKNELAFPESIQAIFRAKLYRIVDEAFSVLKLASIIGRDFSYELLDSITPESVELDVCLEELLLEDLIGHKNHFQRKYFEFKSDVAQDVAYKTILKKELSAIHEIVAENILKIYSLREDENLEVLAHHYSLSNNHHKANQYLHAAGDKATRSFSLKESRDFYEKGMAMLDNQINGSEDSMDEFKRSRIEFSLKWAKSAHYAGSEEFEKMLSVSISYAKDLGSSALLVQLTYWQGQRFIVIGALESAIEKFSECIALAKSVGDKLMLAAAQSAMGRACFFFGEFNKGILNLEPAVDFFKAEKNDYELAYGLCYLSCSSSFTGKLDEGLNYGRTSREYALKVGNPTFEANALLWLGFAHWQIGNWQNCLDCLEEGLNILFPIGEYAPISAGMVWKGSALCFAGRVEEGIKAFKKGIEIMQQNQLFLFYQAAHSMLAYALACDNQIEESIAAQNVAFGMLNEGMKGCEAYVYMAKAIVNNTLETTDSAISLQALSDAESLCVKRGQKAQLALVYYEKGQIKNSSSEENQNNLTAALQLFKELKADFWCAKVDSLLSK